MAGSKFGLFFCVSSWGESHGEGIGAVIDGCPAGIGLSNEIIQDYLNRRKPGTSKYSTPRKEEDLAEILSGVFEGRTTGTPISLMVRNQSHKSADYSQIAEVYRPGHADYTYEQKYGFRDYRGGGRSSGRETIARVAAGAIAKEILKELGIQVTAYTKSIGNITIDAKTSDWNNIRNSPLQMPDRKASELAEKYLKEKIKEAESVGGVIECIVSGMPVGIGEPVFDKLDANLAKAIMSIGAVKGVEIGDGFEAAGSVGSYNNDEMRVIDGQPVKLTNHAGGILGGISDGSEIILRAAVKPTPSIRKKQKTVNDSAKELDIEVGGRHDPIIVPRAVVVVEAMTAITLVDMLFMGMASRIDQIKKIYKK